MDAGGCGRGMEAVGFVKGFFDLDFDKGLFDFGSDVDGAVFEVVLRCGFRHRCRGVLF